MPALEKEVRTSHEGYVCPPWTKTSPQKGFNLSELMRHVCRPMKRVKAKNSIRLGVLDTPPEEVPASIATFSMRASRAPEGMLCQCYQPEANVTVHQNEHPCMPPEPPKG